MKPGMRMGRSVGAMPARPHPANHPQWCVESTEGRRQRSRRRYGAVTGSRQRNCSRVCTRSTDANIRCKKMWKNRDGPRQIVAALAKRGFMRSGFVACLAVLFGLAASAHAQATAMLKGRVTDATGALIRGARLILRDQDTGVVRRASSDAAGEYQFAFLTAGVYRIDVESAGLRPEVIPRIVVEVGRTIV